MIHFHLSEPDARLIVDALDRQVALGEATLKADHMTPEGRALMRTHLRCITVVRDRLRGRLEVAPAKRGNRRGTRGSTTMEDAGEEAGFKD